MILLTLRIVAPAERRHELVRVLRSHVEPTRAEPGCLSCRLYRDIQDENALSLIEEWDARADLERHVRSPRYRQILAVMDAAAEPPDFTIKSIAQTMGMEEIQALQGHECLARRGEAVRRGGAALRAVIHTEPPLV